MKKLALVLISLCGSLGATSIAAQAAAPPSSPSGAVAEAQALANKEPAVARILQKYGATTLDEVDWSKGYVVNRETGTVREVTAADTLQAPTVNLYSSGASIIGWAETKTLCASGELNARVYGHLASNVSRDPIALNREGVLIGSGLGYAVARVEFSVLKIPGARNPLNRSSMETTHVSQCNATEVVTRLVTTWPPQRVEIVADTTGSMGPQIGGLKAGLSAFISTSEERPNGKPTAYELIGFKDSSEVLQESTFDRSIALAAVNGLTAVGGDDCPEDSVGALQLALNRIQAYEDDDAQIILATDASPHESSVGGVDALIAAATARGVKVNVLLSGDCVGAASGPAAQQVTPQNTPSARTVFFKIASETGGMYFYMPGATAQEYADAFVDIFETVTDEAEELAPGVPITGISGQSNDWRTFKVKVPEGAHLLRVFTSGGQGDVSLYARFGTSPTSELNDAASVRAGNTELVNVSQPQSGYWYIRVQGVVEFSGVSIEAALN